MKVVKLTEEQAKHFWLLTQTSSGYNMYLEQLKVQGYILPDPVEEAEELYIKHVEYKGNLSSEEKNNSIDKMYEAIQFLKPYYERLKDLIDRGIVDGL